MGFGIGVGEGAFAAAITGVELGTVPLTGAGCCGREVLVGI